MDHLCYLNCREKEYEKLLTQEKTKLARCTRSRKPPFKHVFSKDRVFFVNKKRNIVLSSEVTTVINIKKTDYISYKELILMQKEDLNISQHEVKKLLRKKYLVIFGLTDVKQVEIFNYQNMDLIKRKKWILAGNLQFDC